MNENAKTLAIVGGGAGGLAAAVEAGRKARQMGRALDIVVYERDDRVGRTILATGNGRCNFSNAQIDTWRYRNADFVDAAYAALDARTYAPGVEGAPEKDEGFNPAMDFFEDLGLAWRQEVDGRRFPLANKASVVVDVLRAAAAAVGVREACECAVASIEPPREQGKRFTLRMADGRLERADAVIVACGGRALDSLAFAEPCSFARVPQVPVLGPLRVADKDITLVRELDNIRVRCTALLMRPQGNDERVCVGSESGELMFRKYGLSGICIFNLSRIAQPGDVVDIDFMDTADVDWSASILRSRARDAEKLLGHTPTYADVLRGMLLPRVSEAVLKTVGIRPDDTLGPEDAERVERLATLLTFFPLEVTGIGDSEICQVRRGGLAVEGFDSATMESRDVHGLYAVGEALDVDGPCGGYNLHWAWSSGVLAAQCAVEALLGGTA